MYLINIKFELGPLKKILWSLRKWVNKLFSIVNFILNFTKVKYNVNFIIHHIWSKGMMNYRNRFFYILLRKLKEYLQYTCMLVF